MKWSWIMPIGLALLTAPVDVPAAPTNVSEFDNGRRSAYQTVARQVKAGQLVRVTTESTRFEMSWMGATHVGIAYRNFDDESGTTFTTGPDSAVARWSEIRRVDVRGRATSTGWPIGAALGVLGGVGYFVYMSQLEHSVELSFGEDLSDELSSEEVARIVVIGAIAGGVGGAIIGSAFPKWHTIYSQEGGGKP